MQQQLVNKLYRYICENNPDVLLELESNGTLAEYLSTKINSVNHLLSELDSQPQYIIEEACMDLMTNDLKPSKFNYVLNLLHEEFEGVYQQLEKSGTLKFEIINLITHCRPVFDTLPFNESIEDSRELLYAIIGTISEYFESNSEKESVINELQQSTKTSG